RRGRSLPPVPSRLREPRAPRPPAPAARGRGAGAGATAGRRPELGPAGVRPRRMSAISVDLPWSDGTKARTAIAAAAAHEGIVVSDGLDAERARRWIVENAAERAVVLLDVPIDGCDALSRSRPRRAVDDGLARVGIPILPSYKS